MTDEKKKMTAQGSSVGADDGQSISTNSKTTIPGPDEKSNSPERDLEELYRKMRRMSDPAYLHTVTLDELMDNVFERKSAVIENLLYTGAYILAGAPKIGKSFLVAVSYTHLDVYKRQGLRYTVRDAGDWLAAPTTRWFTKGSNHSPLQFC